MKKLTYSKADCLVRFGNIPDDEKFKSFLEGAKPGKIFTEYSYDHFGYSQVKVPRES